MNDRMHPQDLRALMAAHIYGQGLQLIAGRCLQRPALSDRLDRVKGG